MKTNFELSYELPNKSLVRIRDTDDGFYIHCLNLLEQAYWQGPYLYKDSAIRWAKAHLNPNRWPNCILYKSQHELATAVYGLDSLASESTSESTSIKSFPPPDEDTVAAFHIIYGENTPYKINPNTGVLEPDLDNP